MEQKSIVAERKWRVIVLRDVLSETPNGGNEVEDKIGPNFPPSLQHQLLQRGLINNRKFGVEMGHKNMEALRKLQKNQSESLPVHSEANVFPYPTVNPEKLMEYVQSERADGFAKGCRP